MRQRRSWLVLSLFLWSSVVAQADSLPLSPGCRKLLSHPKLNFCFSQQARADYRPLGDYEQKMGREGLGMGTRTLMAEQKLLLSGLESLRFQYDLSGDQVDVLEAFCRSEQTSDCAGGVADAPDLRGEKSITGSYVTGFETDRKLSTALKLGRAACVSHDGRVEIHAALDGSGSRSSVGFRRRAKGVEIQRLYINPEARPFDDAFRAEPGAQEASMRAKKDKRGNIKASLYFSDADHAVAVAPGEEGDWQVVNEKNGRVLMESQDTVITYVNVNAKAGRISRFKTAKEIKANARCTVEFERLQKGVTSKRSQFAELQPQTA